ncbi:MAG: S9 family peptidase [Planctomycetes bacterium]|nr:S9 family peptidase [Planctomycetota bacterium]
MNVALLALLLAPLAQTPLRFTFEDVRKAVSWTSDAPATTWAWDGKHVEVRRDPAQWIDPLTGTASEAQKKAKESDTPGKAAPARASVRDGKLSFTPATDGVTKPKTEVLAEVGDAREAHASGDGAYASFVRGNDLVVLDVATKKEWRVTTDGGPERFHGYLDWVYQEEVYGRGDFQGHWWSPKGPLVAFLSLDESPVKDYALVDHVPKGFLDEERSVEVEVANYPKAGDPNPIATLSVADAKTQKVVPVDLAAFPKDLLVVRVDWTPDGATLLVTLQDRIQTWAKLFAVDPRTGKGRVWIEESSETWVDRPEAPRWLKDGGFLWQSARTGYTHLYRYDAQGRLVNAVTSGAWQVRGIERLDEERGLVWIEGTKDGAIDRNVYRVGLDGKNFTRLTQGAGTHAVDFNADASLFLDRWSSMSAPPAMRVCSGDDGTVLRELWKAGKGDAPKYAFAEKQRVSIPARDGFALDGSMLLPTEFDASRKYPVFLPTYSGPDTPTVRDSWGPSSFHQFLCQQGFVVLQLNVRSASGIGRRETGTCYQRLGEQELADLEDAVDWVCAKHGGDPARVAIQGWSYGGFMSAYALTHSTKFALGLAGAGVYDWRLYDTIYTERYMRTPQENKAGYDRTSVIKNAKDLAGHLVIVHGTMDDNVHVQNAIQFTWELQKANKQNFELMLYARSTHGLAGEVQGHERELEWRALRKLLDPAYKSE